MTGYVRTDTANNIADGNIINAVDFDNEFDAIQSAFNNSTGHTHDGTSANGAPITKVGPTQDVVVSATAVTPKTDNTVDLGSSLLEFKDLWIDGTANIDSLVADTVTISAGTIDNTSIGATTASTGRFTTLTATGNATISGTLGVTGAITGSLTGNASTATTLQTARTINGVSFNGSANITVEPYVEQDLTTAATRYIAFVDSSTAGHQRLNLDDTLNYNPSTGTLAATTFSGALSGNATTATTLATARNINGVSFNGSADITVPVNTSQKSDSVAYNIPFVSSVTAGNQNLYTDSAANFTYNPSTNAVTATTFVGALSGNATTATTATTANATAATLTIGSYLTGSNFNGSTATTWAVDATSANTASKVVARDASGNFSAGTITAALSGNASTATTLATARTIALSGAVTGTATSFNGSANITIPTTVSTTQGGIVYGSSSTAYGTTAAGTAGQMIVSNGTSAPTWQTPSLLLIPDSTFKKSVRCATTANITLSGTQTIDGIAVVADDRVLVKNQTTASQNGIYVVAAGAWTRSTDADAASEIGAAVVAVDAGTANGGEMWTTTFKTTDTLGTTAMNWYEMLYNSGTWGISISGSAATLTTARTLTIGATGKTFNGSANVSWTTAEIGAVARTSATGSAIIPVGTTAQRDGTPTSGYFRYNTDLGKFEGYNGTSWGSVGGGATGGGSDAVFIENDQTVTTNYTITTGKNAGTFGPITVASGVTVTVPSGSVWTIV